MCLGLKSTVKDIEKKVEILNKSKMDCIEDVYGLVMEIE